MTNEKRQRSGIKNYAIILVLIGVIITLLIVVIYQQLLKDNSSSDNSTGITEQMLHIGDYRGMNIEEVKIELEKSGFQEGIDYSIEWQPNAEHEPDTIILQSPINIDIKQGNTKINRIKLTVSVSPESIVLFNYSGRNAEDVKMELSRIGISVEEHFVKNLKFQAGMVIKTEPAAGVILIPGDVVTLFISIEDEDITDRILRVGDYRGMNVEEAKIELERSGFREGIDYSIEWQPNAEHEPNRVISQSPINIDIKPGDSELSRIKLIVSAVPDPIVLIDYSGKKAEDVKVELSRKGVSLNEQFIPSQEFQVGTLIKTEPGTGATVVPGDVVTLYISLGDKDIVVPDLAGTPYPDAEKILASVGLKLAENITSFEEYTSDDLVNLVVIWTNPKARTAVKAGTEITVHVGTRNDYEKYLNPENN